jgi:hypothetical protein
MFPIFSLQQIFQPPPFEEFLEINFQFSMVSILHREGYDHQQLGGLYTRLSRQGSPSSILDEGTVFPPTFLPLLYIDIPFSCNNRE